jgi:YesN/AraC family two-component response regulator
MNSFEGQSVLIVDDESDMREVLQEFLQPYIKDIFTATNGLEAWELMRERHIDILIADINMPEMNGLELLGKIRWYHPDVFVIVISGDPLGKSKKEDIIYQGYNFLSKPFSRMDLFNVLNLAIQQDSDEERYIRKQGKARQVAPGTRIVNKRKKSINMSKKMKTWLSFYKYLNNFRKKYPGRWPKYREVWRNKNLGYWVSVQRKEYRNKEKGEESSITVEQIELLNDIEFAWESSQLTWSERFEALLEFRKENPDRWPNCYGDEKELGIWCSYQRTQYKKFNSNEKNNFSQDKIDKLNEINFEWVYNKN